MKKVKKRTFWFSVVGMLAMVIITLKLGEAIDFRKAIQSDQRAASTVRVGNTQIKWIDFVFERVLRDQLHILDYALVTTRTSTLWATIYLLSGLAGGIAAMWLAAAGIRSEDPLDRERLWPRLASSAVAGVLIYLILRLPSSVVAKFIAIIPDAETPASTDSLLEQCIVLAVLGGLFTSVFFTQLEDSFKSLLKVKSRE